ncbi:MAG: dephospho-CoA kinase [Pedobacter sp.]|jgi:dephospho-CoA kinase
MFRIGITGGIGSGKTTVCKVFELLGIPVFYADSIAKSIMHTDAELKDQIIRVFGKDSYSENGDLDRAYISSIVFKDEAELQKLNSLVHPAVFRAFDLWVSEQVNVPYVMKEAALLFESDSYKMCDQTILVLAPEEIRIARVTERDKISEDEVKLRMKKQWPDAEKQKLANYILRNDESHLLIPEIIDLHRQFIETASGR